MCSAFRIIVCEHPTIQFFFISKAVFHKPHEIKEFKNICVAFSFLSSVSNFVLKIYVYIKMKKTKHRELGNVHQKQTNLDSLCTRPTHLAKAILNF